MRLLIDTSIFVDNLRLGPVNSSKHLLKSLENKNEGYASTITVAELSIGAYLSPKSDALEKTLELLSIVNIVDVNKDIALKGGEIYSNLVKKGLEIELNDCLIAATAISLGITRLVTRNTEHFQRIKGIKAIIPEELRV
jgi:tRNA(fMet)-specific endonuclease VapC